MFMFFFNINSYAYEAPKVDLSKKAKPTIVLFNAQSIVEDGIKKYKITWKTLNATHVQITFLGNVKLSDTIIITEKEYQHGPITLTATSTESSFSDSKTINKFSKAEREAPILIREETKDINQEFYTPMPYMYDRYNRRRILPRRLRR
jgi:hypothetical protein